MPAKKYWTIPVDKLGFLINQFKGTRYEYECNVYSAEHLNENATIDATTKIPDVDLTNIPLYVQEGKHLFQHQLDFMKFAIDRQHHGYHEGFILADQMGAGKSLEATNLALYNKKFNKVKHCLIVVCVNSAKYNWVDDITTHTNGEYVPYILGSRKKRDGSIKLVGSSTDKLQDLLCGHMYGDKDEDPLPYFLILNIEGFHYRAARKYPIRERLTTLINKGYIGMVVIDEVHTHCLVSDTKILTNLGTIPIGDIVRNKLHVLVKSYNEITHQFEWKPVINWVEHNLNAQLLELTIETPDGVKVIQCTSDHKFYTKNRGWVLARDLTPDDDIVCI